MNPTFSAAAKILHLSIAQFQRALSDMPDEAADWTPAPGMSSFSVLVVHATTSTRFFIETGAGAAPSRDHYYRQVRPRVFATSARTIQSLVDELSEFDAAIDGIVSGAGDAELSQALPWEDILPDRNLRDGADSLLHGVAHFREHVGHAEVMRDMWEAGIR